MKRQPRYIEPPKADEPYQLERRAYALRLGCEPVLPETKRGSVSFMDPVSQYSVVVELPMQMRLTDAVRWAKHKTAKKVVFKGGDTEGVIEKSKHPELWKRINDLWQAVVSGEAKCYLIYALGGDTRWAKDVEWSMEIDGDAPAAKRLGDLVDARIQARKAA